MDTSFESDRPDFSRRDLTRRAVLGRVAISGGLAAVLLPLTHTSTHAQPTPGAVAPSFRAAPNTFSLIGRETRIEYATSSLDGTPSFLYSGVAGEVIAHGDDIRTLEDVGPFGHLVTITVETIPDLWFVTLTLALPTINLVGGSPTPFATFAILTTHQITIGGPDMLDGALQSYEVTELAGTAQLLLFE